jgi:hypothetical protein
MHLYISAERENTYFIDNIKKYCANSHGRHTCIFLPDLNSLPGETLSTKVMQNIFGADLIFMDATPIKFFKETGNKNETEWFTNQRIIVEYAMAVTLGKTEDMKVYCRVSPDHLHQVFRERIVDAYPANDDVAFLNYIDKIVTQREQDSYKLMRQARIGGKFS